MKDELAKGGVYKLQSRNLTVGVYDGNEGFIGIREKFGDEYLFTEYLCREQGGTKIPLDTVRVLGQIGRVSEFNPLCEYYGLVCKNCGKGAWKDEGGTYPTNEHCGGGCPDGARSVYVTMNQLLFDVLRGMELASDA